MSTLLKKPCTVKRGNLEHFTLLDSAASGQTLHVRTTPCNVVCGVCECTHACVALTSIL